jgi:hypothetical protein
LNTLPVLFSNTAHLSIGKLRAPQGRRDHLIMRIMLPFLPHAAAAAAAAAVAVVCDSFMRMAMAARACHCCCI